MKPKTVGREGGGKGPADPFETYAQMDTGLIKGALLLTLDGEIPVEFLSLGDKLITRDSGISKVRHIQRIARRIMVVRIGAGTLGASKPEQPADLAADQMVLIRDWRARSWFNAERALVSARALVDGKGIQALDFREVTLFQIFCDGPHIIYCDGLELSTADGARARGAVLHAA